MNATTTSIKSSRSVWVVMLAVLAALSLAFVWRGAGRMMRMQTQAASTAEFAQMKANPQIFLSFPRSSTGKIGRPQVLHRRGFLLYCGAQRSG